MSRWLVAEHFGIEELSEAWVEAFLATQRASGRDRSVSRPGLLCLLELLRALGVATVPVRPRLGAHSNLRSLLVRASSMARGSGTKPHRNARSSAWRCGSARVRAAAFPMAMARSGRGIQWTCPATATGQRLGA